MRTGKHRIPIGIQNCVRIVMILTPGRLVPIEDVVQVLPDKLVGTQIAFKLADEDCPLSYK